MLLKVGLLVGLHPDQCTDLIVKLALPGGHAETPAVLEHEGGDWQPTEDRVPSSKAFAVVPCCVFADTIPRRFAWSDFWAKETPQSHLSGRGHVDENYVTDDHRIDSTPNNAEINENEVSVREYEQLLVYLWLRSPHITAGKLGFVGRDIVLYDMGEYRSNKKTNCSLFE